MSISAVGAAAGYAPQVHAQAVSQPPVPAARVAAAGTDSDGDNDGSKGGSVDVRASAAGRHAGSRVPGVSRDEAARLAEKSLGEFIARMAAAGNPGLGRHEIGLHHVEGWILDYDGTIGGSEIQAVIGVDGNIHARREPRSLRTRKLSAAAMGAARHRRFRTRRGRCELRRSSRTHTRIRRRRT